MKHILVATDFSAPADRALDTGIELARAFGARLTILHVWSMPYTSYSEGLTWPVDEMERAARRALDDTLARAVARYPRTEAVLLQGGDWAQILEAVRELGVDLVVMGTHGRRGLPRLVLGSVAERVVRMSPVPVLTIKGVSGTDATTASP